jgi:hypothetical protein
MALRSETKIGALVILGLWAPLLSAEPLAYQVRHRHLRRGTVGVLRIADDSISFQEEGKHKAHSRQWQFAEIQQLTLSAQVLCIRTYEDDAVKFFRDREFVFDNLPKELAAQLYPLFSRRLDQRFVAALADDTVDAGWQAPVKLLHRNRGSQGAILVGADRVVYRTGAPEESRTWRIADIDAVSSSSPFDLTVTTFERAGANYADHRDFRFQLKRPLTEIEYNGLWRTINQAKGLQILSPLRKQGEKQ